MARPKRTTAGPAVRYRLNADDARLMNDKRGGKTELLQAGMVCALEVTHEHQGDCVDGIVRCDGAELEVTRRNRGFSEGQWNWENWSEEVAA